MVFKLEICFFRKYIFCMQQQDLWAVLPLEIRKKLESHATTLEFKRGEFVYRQGDVPKGMYFVKSGLVGLVLVGAQSGKEHLMRFFKAGQFFGHRALFSEEPYHGDTVVMEPTVIRFIEKKLILDILAANPLLLMDITRILSKELRRCENHQLMILENQILPRIAQSLIYLKDLYPDHNWTRQEIANFCASTVSTVIKAMAELENMGLIEQSGRVFNILSREKLLELQEVTI